MFLLLRIITYLVLSMQLQRRQNLNYGVSFLLCLHLLCLASGGPWRKFFFRYEFYFFHSFSHVCLCYAIKNPSSKHLFGPFLALLLVGLDPDTFPRMMHILPDWIWSEKHTVSVFLSFLVVNYWISFGSVSVDFYARLHGENNHFVLATLSFTPKFSAFVDNMLFCFIEWNSSHIRISELLFESIHFILR